MRGGACLDVASHRSRYLRAALGLGGTMAALFVGFLVWSGLPVGVSSRVVRESYPAISPDGPGYVTVTDFFRGEDVVLDRSRVSRPLVPLLALPLSYVVPTELSYIVVNAALFLLLVGAFFGLAEHLLGTAQHGFYATVLLIFSFPVYYRGINVTVDLASWLIFVVTARVLVELERRGAVGLSTFTVLSALCGLATLVTELVFSSFLLVLSFYLIRRRRQCRPLRLVADSGTMAAAAGAVVLLLQATIYLVFDYGFFEQLQRQVVWFSENPLNLGLAGFVRVLVGAFLVSLLLVPVGLLDLRQSMQDRELAAAMLVAALLTLLAVYTHSIRFVFVLFPVVFPIAVLGVVRLAGIGGAVFGLGRRGTLAIEVALLSGVCAINVATYAGVLRYGSTIEMARRLLPFLL